MVDHVKLTGIVPSSQLSDFKLKLAADYHVVLDALLGIDVRHAKAYLPNDQKNISEFIKETVGFERMNNVIRSTLRELYLDSCMSIAAAEIASGRKDAAAAQICVQIATVLKTFSKIDHARKLYEQALAINLICLEPHDPDLAISYSNVGAVYQASGKHDDALEYLHKCLKLLVESGKLHHILYIASTYHNMGAVYLAQWKMDMALEHFQKCLALMLTTVGSIASKYCTYL